MRKASTYYFLGVFLFNAWVQLVVYGLNTGARRYLEPMAGSGPDIPVFFITHLTWWPAVVAGLAAVGFTVSMYSAIRSASLLHWVIALLTVDCLVFPCHLIAIVAINPMIPPVRPPQHVLATGQTKCYDDLGTVIECTSTEYPGQDGFYQKGYPMAGRFVDNGDGTVTDKGTGLMWQKETADTNGDGTIDSEHDGLTLQEALQYCESLEFAGHDDWRLPNVRELQSIVDYGRFDPSIDPVFGAVPSNPISEIVWYWSSSTSVGSPGHAWCVDFNVGDAGRSPTCNPIYVRAVRDAN